MAFEHLWNLGLCMTRSEDIIINSNFLSYPHPPSHHHFGNLGDDINRPLRGPAPSSHTPIYIDMFTKPKHKVHNLACCSCWKPKFKVSIKFWNCGAVQASYIRNIIITSWTTAFINTSYVSDLQNYICI